MNKWILKTLLALATISFLAVNADAAKKNAPDEDDLENILKDLGEEHYVEDMKINDLCTLEFEDEETEEEIYYHVFVGSLRKGGYHVIVCDNTPRYLGYYKVQFEPTDYEEKAILLDSGESDEEGNTDYYFIRFDKNGPKDKINIDGTPIPFVKNKKAEEEAKKAEEEEAKKAAKAEPIQPEYREWTLKMRGQEFTFSAIYVKRAGSKIYLKEEKRGITKDFPESAFSNEDLEYLKRVAQ